MRWIVLLVLVLAVVGCQETAEQKEKRECEFPLMESGERCCMDQDNNSVCDKDEEGVVPVKKAIQETGKDKEPETTDSEDEPEKTETAVPRATKITEEERKERKISLAQSLMGIKELSDTDYLDTFTDEPTLIIFDSGSTTGSMVTAALNIKLYLNNPSKVDLYTDASLEELTESDIEAVFRKNLILMGNGCNNDFIKEILGAPDNNCNTLEKDKAMMRLYELDGNRILMVMGFDDEDVYKVEKKIVDEDISYSGNVVEIELE